MRASTLLLCTLLLSSAPAWAEPDDEATRAAVRTLGYEGVEHYEAGDYAAAIDKLDKAYALTKVPTLGLWSARALRKLGRWVEASERYFDVTRLPLPELEPEVHAEAQREAKAEREAMLPRIPKLTLVVPDTGHGVTVTLDGRPVALELVGTPIPIDPGEHHVIARRDDQRVERAVTATEGKQLEVELLLPPWQPPPEPPSSATPAPRLEGAVAPVAPTPPRPADEGMSTQAVAGWATLGLGGAVFTAGVVLGSVALAKRNALDCPDGRCPAELAEDVETVNDLRAPSTITIAAGLVGLGTGTLLLLTVPDRDEVALSVGPTGGRLRVIF